MEKNLTMKSLYTMLMSINDRLDNIDISLGKINDRFVGNEKKIEDIRTDIDRLDHGNILAHEQINDIKKSIGKCDVGKTVDDKSIESDEDISDCIDELAKAAEAMKDYVEKTFNISFDNEDEDEDNFNDSVNHPSHYTDGKYEVIDFIEQYASEVHIGNAVKYICRAGKKDEDTYIEDLKKAEWYLLRYHDGVLSGKFRDCSYVDYHNESKERINISDFCKDKKLCFELTKVINFICLGQIYSAYLALHEYIGYCEELGED